MPHAHQHQPTRFTALPAARRPARLIAGQARLPRRLPGARSGKILLALAAIVLGAASLGAWLIFGDDSASQAERAADIHLVERGHFEVVIPASGELAAMRQVEIANRLESRAIITEIVAEGTFVRAGDLLFRLADEEIRNRIKDAVDAVTTANANAAAADSALAVRKSSAESELERANLAINLAELALLAWTNAEMPSKVQSLSVAKVTADINHERLKAKFEESEELLKNEHISKDEYERDRIAMIEAQARLQTAVLDVTVYEEYYRPTEEAIKKSDLSQANAERQRVHARNEAEINNAKVALESANNRLLSASDRLADLERQLTYCVVTAPSAGLVVYSSSMESNRWGGGGDRSIQVGTELRPNETVIILPDTTQMVAAVKVNEALTGQIRAGQRVRVVSDALPNVTLEGEVLSIGVLAEQSGWRDPNRREYTVRVLLTNATEQMGLKPSMRCRAEVIVDTVSDALHVPIQAVFRRGGNAHVYIADGREVQRRVVRTGRASELKVEVLNGLAEGEHVLLREPTGDEMRRPAVDAPVEGGEQERRRPDRGLASAGG